MGHRPSIAFFILILAGPLLVFQAWGQSAPEKAAQLPEAPVVGDDKPPLSPVVSQSGPRVAPQVQPKNSVRLRRTARDLSQWSFFVGSILWNDQFKLQNDFASTEEMDRIQFQATWFGAGRRGVSKVWGYEVAGFVLSGKATAGSSGNSVSYQSGVMAMSGLGGRAQVFYRLERFVELGFAGSLLWAQYTLPLPNEQTRFEKPLTPSPAFALFWRLRPHRSFYFEQSFGPVGVRNGNLATFSLGTIF